MHFWLFWAKYCHFLHNLSNARPKTNVNKVPRWVFRYVGNKTFDFSNKKKDFLPKNDQIWPNWAIWQLAFLVNLGQTMQAYSVPCWWVGWWFGAQAVSRKTPIYFIELSGKYAYIHTSSEDRKRVATKACFSHYRHL